MLRSDVRTLGTFFRMVEMDVSEVAHHADALDRLRSGDLHSVMVHNVYPPDVLQGVVERLERHHPPFLKTWFPMAFRSWFFGRNLNLLTDPDLRGYFRDAAVFHQHLEQLFPPAFGITTYVAGLLASLDHGRPFRAPPGPNPGEQ